MCAQDGQSRRGGRVKSYATPQFNQFPASLPPGFGVKLPEQLLKSLSSMKQILFLSLLLAGACFAQKATSVYTSTALKDVKVLSSSELEKNPEIDHFEHLCKGKGGYELFHRSGDLRSWIDVRFKGTTSDLYSATMQAGRGEFVAKQNNVVEWRGTMKGDVFSPYAIIYRIIAQDPEDFKKSNSTLVIIALNKGNSKILGTTHGKNEDAQAKKLADTAAP